MLDTARQALSGSRTTTEAKVTAALARQLQHSVPADRPRARPLADEAVGIARTLDDPATLASCLLAQHDTLWSPGTATARAAIAAAIVDLAKRADDRERHAQALLLSATAQLENGSPAFRATLTEYAYLTERLRQPRHDYLLRTRQAALALLDGDIDTGERLSAEAATLGEAVGDSDTGNVRMSQRLEIVRARNRPRRAARHGRRSGGLVGRCARRTRTPSRPGSMPAPAISTPPAGTSTPSSRWTTGVPTGPISGRSSSARWSPPRSRCATARCAGSSSTTCFRWPTPAR